MTVMEIPEGHLATIVTYLEMTKEPALSDIPSGLEISEWPNPEPDEYLAMFRKVGENWLWFSRLLLDKDQLIAVIQHDDVQLHKILDGSRAVGFIELDFREAGQCEIGFFGLVPEMNGSGHGRWMMVEALRRAWRSGVERVWLHTCTLDSPRALGFYQNSGFRAYKQEVGMQPDPRLSGHLPRSAAPHIPLLS
ncbi:GNAT family N-acetyltransferase [Parasphingorhabdus halotolerans]|uniref:GNAT family N-acetyltransferase n=2 Tax=Parasphingorhabdus halotolerans TaxID=2725558 RepID=A0A6H2DJU5_9SPHN|nr:GNAT family N-acetyltransferase [Parasphingorhabdus halotolerans]